MVQKKISGRERILSAMNLQRTDRIPLMCQFSLGFMMTQLKVNPVLFWYDEETYANGLIDLCKKFKFDGILVSLFGHSLHWDDVLKEKIELSPDKYKLVFDDRYEIHSVYDLPVVSYVYEKTVKEIDDIDIDKDLPSNINYIPVSHNLYFRLDYKNLFHVFDYIRDKVGDEYSIHGEITSPFDYFLDFLGYENALVSLIINPIKSKAILQKYTDMIIDLTLKMCDHDIDAVKISSPFAGMGFISREFYEEFVVPYEKQIVEAIKSKCKYVYLHTCGAINDRLELMIKSGISGLECLDPYPIGNVDLKDAFLRIGEKIFIKGNIDSVNTLLLGEDKKVENDIVNIINIGKKYGKGFILSTACSIAPLVKRERILLLSELIDKYGRYENI